MKLQSLCLLSLLSFGLPSVAPASELSYTYLDFQWVGPQIDVTASQRPVPSQTVDIVSGNGSGVSIGGALALVQGFYLVGTFQSSIVDVEAVVSNPLGVTEVFDKYDFIRSRAGIGYLFPIGDNFDIVLDLTYDTSEYDFGSLAGENFDTHDAGAGAQVGFRWNPILPFELFAFSRYSTVGMIDLNRREFESDTHFNLGFRWYFFEDLGMGVEYETGQVDTVTVSMRFSFGNLPW